MNITRTPFEGLLILDPVVWPDERGYFMEAFNEQTLKKLGIEKHFVQDNQSFSRKNVMRGLHFQRNPVAQTKLIRVLAGRILDVVVDIRNTAPTFGKSFSIELSDDNKKQLYVPAGFAHGFIVLSDEAEVLYKTDHFYNKEAEGGIFFNDPALGIDWGIRPELAVVSPKDLLLPALKEIQTDF